MRCRSIVFGALGLSNVFVNAASTLLSGGTIIAWDDDTNYLKIIRNGSVLITDDRIAAVNTDPLPSKLPSGTKLVDISNQILTPGFIDTHRHGWQTVFKTIGSNTSLTEYFSRYGEYFAADKFTAADVYISQLAGLYEAMNGGVTTLLDHASHTWSASTSYAGFNASIESGARVFWAFTFHNITSLNYTTSDQIPTFREMAKNREVLLKDSPTELGVAYDYWGSNPNVHEAQTIANLVSEFNVSVVTTHSLAGPWGFSNLPSQVQQFNILNGTVPVVFSHSSFITADDLQLLRSTNQYISITAESEMQYGHGHPHSYYAQDQAALGIDTHFTYSADILTQARMWLQAARHYFYNQVLENWHVPTYNPMSANQAFLLATRSGGLALRRPDLGVIKVGAKADLVVWDAENSPSLLGWEDPVAAIILHANIGDVLHVLIDGKFVKKDGKLVNPDYPSIRKTFLNTSKKIQKIWKGLPYPTYEGTFASGYGYGTPETVDVQRGKDTGYGTQFL
ncbi:amidohydrolase family [Trichoderma arundinaceum]|uniref:Amidohydrolase family n=1 Tax=Trichoderma arundinaceum TaxID=490622 RepID=A0A395NUG0_TRIAR|nr:amidohydrolase family [Trichoderma arundinaceum]